MDYFGELSSIDMADLPYCPPFVEYAECPLCLEPIDYCQGHPDGCEWCLDENADDAMNPEKLCRMHLSEYEGLSLAEMDRRDHEEWLDQQ